MILHARADRMVALAVTSMVLAALVFVFLLPSDALIADRNTDMVGEFVAWRAFLADSLRHGHLPLWNPYTYSGQPFIGGFESAVLYPPNLLFAITPLAPALNFSLLLHLILLGWGMERWARARGLHPWAAALAGLVMPLSGPVFPHIFAGHLSNLCTMAWAPWIFLGLESWTRQGNRRGLLLASAAICLQLLAGHVQYFFYTAVAAGFQALVVTIADPTARRRAIPTVIGCYLAGALLGAAQLLPGLAALSEGIRQNSLDHDFSAWFSFPPENFLTVIAPGFFGTLSEPWFEGASGQSVYWGRCFLWETSLYMGAVAPLLIAIALTKSGHRRQVMFDLITATFLLVLALGAHTPLFDLFYYFVPVFGHFRSWSKFIFPATLFLVLAVAAGVDTLFRGKLPPRGIALAGIIAGDVALFAGTILLFSPNILSGFLLFISSTHESYLSSNFFTNAKGVPAAGWHAGFSLVSAGTVLLVAGLYLYFQEKNARLRFALPLILSAEMLSYAVGLIPAARLSDAMPPTLRQFIASHPGDYRILDLNRSNNGYLLGKSEISGDNPSALRRYGEFMNFIQSENPDHATQYLPFHRLDSLYTLLRLRYVIWVVGDSYHVVENIPPPMPRLSLIANQQVVPSRDTLFAALRKPTFDPTKTVLLETPARPAPTMGTTGTVRLLSDQADDLEIEADIDHPVLLLVTDLYARGWSARPAAGSAQKSYEILPADYILRAIPLTAGHHHLHMVYSPVTVPIGLTLSVGSWIVWLVLLVGLKETATRKNSKSPSIQIQSAPALPAV